MFREVRAPRGCAALFVGVCWMAVVEAQAPARTAPRELPGVKRDGSVLLPNRWTLRPTGAQTPLGNFPVNIAVHPSGKWLAILHAGADVHEIAIVDATQREVLFRVTLPQTFYGLAFSPTGDVLFASGGEFARVHRFGFRNGALAESPAFEAPEPREKTVIAGLAVAPDGAQAFAASPWDDRVFRFSATDGKPLAEWKMPAKSYPYTILASADRAFVSLWGGAAVAVVERATDRISAIWKTEAHPTEMALTPDGKRLFVSCANSTKVSVLDAVDGKPLETLHCALHPQTPPGVTPSGLCLSDDGALLFVANADANNVALFNVSEAGESKPLGFIPVGWYPTSVRYLSGSKKIFVANGKGAISRANPQGPQPGLPQNLTTEQYIGRLFPGTLSAIDLPEPREMALLTARARACCPVKEDAGATLARPEGNPIPAKVGDPSPIKHCIYIVKENRTYDQILGDMPEGNGDPALCLFPENVTPNHHKIAREFVLLDNFYVDGEVSADGHEWTMGAYATDYVEKVWPLKYRRGGPRATKLKYPSEGEEGAIAFPAGGYFWDKCQEAGVSFRSYGEFIQNAPKVGDPGTAKVKTLEGHFDPFYRSYELTYSDVKRAERFIEELRRYERDGGFPQFVVLRLPNDHTAGTALGRSTPTAMVAENDLALGRIVEAVSLSKFWKETAIFVIEDDAQNGPDHVDAHRSVALVASPYCKRGVVDSTMYSTSSMLRTMGLILGTKPMSQFDAAAHPMYGSFRPTPDLKPYKHEAARVDLHEINQPGAWGQERTSSFRLEKEDQADDLAFNEVIWRSVKGKDSPMPAPVRAGFFRPKD